MIPSQPHNEFTRRDAYQRVTDLIAAQLNKGTCPWRKPWDPATSAVRPLNIRGTLYRGGNRLILASTDYSCPVWLTFKQAQDRGGHVRKGEHGMPIYFWQFDSIRDLDDDDNSEEKRSGHKVFLRISTAFNLEQTEGVKIPDGILQRLDGIAHREHKTIAEADAIVEGYKDAPSIHLVGNKAYYHPSDDSVTMPTPECFVSDETYYGVLFHELGHSTGHQSRLARSGITDSNMFGSHEYSREELVAELTSAFLSAECGIGRPLLDNSVAYIQSWLTALRNDRTLFVIAAGQAQKATDHILGV